MRLTCLALSKQIRVLLVVNSTQQDKKYVSVCVFKLLSPSFLSPPPAAQSCNLHSPEEPKSYFPLLIARPVRGDFSVQGQLTAHPNPDCFTWKLQEEAEATSLNPRWSHRLQLRSYISSRKYIHTISRGVQPGQTQARYLLNQVQALCGTEIKVSAGIHSHFAEH